jgi:hypothetical protein
MNIGVIFLENGESKDMFDYYSSGYEAPEKDETRDWYLDKTQSKMADGQVEIHFLRKLVTEDTEKVRKLK